MGYERKTAMQALEKAEAGVDAGLPAAEKEKLLFKEAIINLSNS